MKKRIPCLLFLVVAGLLTAETVQAQGTAFTYQGRLNTVGGAANGSYDLMFTVYDSTNEPGTIVAGPLTNSAVGVSNGLFTVTLDFLGGIFDGNPRWLEIGVRTNGAGTFTTLSPRQALLPAPYAIAAGNLVGSATNQVNSAVQAATNAFVGTVTNIVTGQGYVNSSITNGLVTTNYVNTATNTFVGTVNATVLGATNNLLATANANILSATNNLLVVATNAANLIGVLPQYPTVQIATNAPFTNAVLVSPDGTNRIWSAGTNLFDVAGAAQGATNNFVETVNDAILGATNNALVTATNSFDASGVASAATNAFASGELLSATNSLLTPQFYCNITTFTNPAAAPIANSDFGTAVAGIGSNDFIITAYNKVGSYNNAGQAFYYTNGVLSYTLDDPSPQASYDSFGTAVASTGSNSFVITAYFKPVSGHQGAGQAYYYTNGVLKFTINDPSSISSYEHFGTAVASVGSNGFIITAPSKTIGGNTGVGQAYFYTNGVLAYTIANPFPVTYDNFGSSVSSVGSNNFIIGAEGKTIGGNSTVGQAYFYTNGVLAYTITNPSPNSGDNFGNAVSGVGSNSFVITAFNKAVNGDSQVGQAYFYTNGVLACTITNPSPHSGDNFGNAVASVGSNSFIITAYNKTVNDVSQVGQAYLYTNGVLAYTIADPSPEAIDTFGNSVASVGSNNFLIGVFTKTVGTVYAVGLAYLYQLAVTSPLIPEMVQSSTNNVLATATNSFDALGAAQGATNNFVGTVNGTVLGATNNLLTTANANILTATNNLIATANGNILSATNNALATATNSFDALGAAQGATNNLVGTVNATVLGATNTFVGTVSSTVLGATNNLLTTANANILSATNNLLVVATNAANLIGILPQYPTLQVATNAPFTNAVLVSPDGTNRIWSAGTNLFDVAGTAQGATNNLIATANANILSATNNVLATATNNTLSLVTNKVDKLAAGSYTYGLFSDSGRYSGTYNMTSSNFNGQPTFYLSADSYNGSSYSLFYSSSNVWVVSTNPGNHLLYALAYEDSPPFITNLTELVMAGGFDDMAGSYDTLGNFLGEVGGSATSSATNYAGYFPEYDYTGNLISSGFLVSQVPLPVGGLYTFLGGGYFQSGGLHLGGGSADTGDLSIDYSYVHGYGSGGIGRNNYAETNNEFVCGTGVVATQPAQWAHAAGGVNGMGTSQESSYQLSVQTTTANSTNLQTSPHVLTNFFWQFNIQVVALDNAAQGGCAGWFIRGIVKNPGGYIALVGTPTVDTWSDQTLLTNATCSVSANTTNDCLDIVVTGVTNHTISWSGGIHSQEVGSTPPYHF